MSSSFSSWPQSPNTHSSSKDRQKKPRHRHSPAQLAALNELFENSDHPTLDERSTLADRLGMETKTVNAWFQNKRASTKKRTRSNITYDLPPISSILGSTSSSSTNTPHQTELDDFADDDYALDRHSRSTSLTISLEDPQHQSSFYAGNPEHRHLFAESEVMPRRMRVRPTVQQTDELRKLYNINPHPTKEAREELGERIGMRYQSITNWFQNQRSLAKKRKEDEAEANKTYSVHESRTFSAFPPPPSGYTSPILSLSPPNHSLALKARRSPSNYLPSSVPFPSSRPLSPRTPHRDTLHSISGSRRFRPETHQLHALKDLFIRTSNPTIEQRSALASEIGMDVGKVTNWFRNLRQSTHKRSKMIDGEDEDEGGTISSSISRFGTPSFHSSSSSSENGADDLMDLDGDEYDGRHKSTSDNGSEDEHEEAVTPSPESSPSPLSPTFAAGLHHLHGSLGLGTIDPSGYAELEKATAARFSGIKVEDALLLLSFHQHAVH